MSLQLAVAVGRAGQAVERMVGNVEFHHAAADVLQPLVCVVHDHAGPTGVVQEDGVPARPSISTRQSRHEPKASTMSVGQRFGISMPASIEARMIDVPSGTVTSNPSIVERHRSLPT